eukprot:SAG31_NODE_2663_length_5278_cov_29.536011_3_plen_233_part_00
MDRDQVSIQDRSGLLFFQAMNGAFGSAINTCTAIPTQLQVVSRERTAGMYSLTPFYVATFIVLIPLDTLPVIFNACVIYFMTNLGGNFFVCAIAIALSPTIMQSYSRAVLLSFVSPSTCTDFALLALEFFVGISLGMLISSLVRNVEMAPRVAPAFVILFLMFSGFFLNDESVPVYMSWLKHISFIRYTFQGLCVNEFKVRQTMSSQSTRASTLRIACNTTRMRPSNVTWQL